MSKKGLSLPFTEPTDNLPAVIELPTIRRIEDIPPPIAGQHIVVVGNVGSGKTWTVKVFVEMILHERRRCVIWDPTGVWWGLRYRRDGLGLGFRIALIGGQFGAVPIDPDAGELYGKIIGNSDVPVILDVSELTMGERHAFATDVFQSLYHHNRRPLHLIVDESDEVAPQNPLPETRRMLGAFDRIIRRGRVRGFRSMMITQRPAVLHKNVLSQASTLIAMRLLGSQDRDAVEAWIKGQADMSQGKTMLASLPSLQIGEGWIWSPSLRQPLQKITFPSIETMDSSRTPSDEEPALTPPELPMPQDILEFERRFETIREPSAEEPSKPVKSKSKPAAIAAPIDTKQIEEAAYKRGLTVGLSAMHKRVVEDVNELLSSLGRGFLDLEHSLASTRPRESTTSEDIAEDWKAAGPIAKAMAADYAADKVGPPTIETVRKKAAATRVAAGLDGAAGKLLRAFAQMQGQPITWEDACILAFITPGNGYFYGGKRYLIDQGLVAGEPPRISAAGDKAAGGVFDKPKRSSVVFQWQSHLRPPGGKMLEVLAAAPRDSMTVEALARAISTKPGNGYWYGGMKSMRKANLIREESGQISLCTFLSKLR